MSANLTLKTAIGGTTDCTDDTDSEIGGCRPKGLVIRVIREIRGFHSWIKAKSRMRSTVQQCSPRRLRPRSCPTRRVCELWLVRSLRAPWLVPLACALAGFVVGYAGFRGGISVAPVQPSTLVEGPSPQPAIAVAAGSSEDRVAALLAAARELDPLRRDAALFHAIERLLPGDLPGATGDLPGFVARLGKLPRNLRLEVVEAIVEHWLAVDPDAALRYFGGPLGLAKLNAPETSPEDAEVLVDSLAPLARHQPEWMLARAQEFIGESNRQTALSSLFSSLAERDPAKARRYFAQLPSRELRESLRGACIAGFAKSDPASALAMAREVADPEARAGFIVEVAFARPELHANVVRAAIAEVTDPAKQYQLTLRALGRGILAGAESAYAWLQEVFAAPMAGMPEQYSLVEELYWYSLMSRLNLRSPERVEALLASMSGPARKQATAANFLTRASDDPGGALAWIVAQPTEVSLALPDRLAITFQEIARKAPEEWQRWLVAQPPGPLRDHAMLAAIPLLAEAGRWEEAVESYRRSIALDGEGGVGADLAGTFAESDGPGAAAWVATLPAGVVQTRAVEAVGEQWSLHDPAAAALWIEQLPAGDLRDGATAGYAQAVKDADPPAAAASLERIGAATTRQRVAEEVFRAWHQENPVAARRWLRGLAGLDAEWMESTLKNAR